MRKKIFGFLNNIYGIAMTASFFAGFLPFIAYIVALIVGGSTGEKIALFLQNDYYPYVIIVGSVALVIGLIAMYVGKLEALSIKNVSADNEESENK